MLSPAFIKPFHLLMLMLFFLAPLAEASSPDNDLRRQYRLGPGDRIQITVNDEPDLSLEVKIQPNGRISYAFLGELTVSGLSIAQMEQLLRERLSSGYLRNPIVNVAVDEYRMYFVNGEIRAAGGFPYQPGLTVRKAVTLAGGFTERADEDRMLVIRGSDPELGEQYIGLDDPLFPDDILTVPEGFW